MNVKHILVAEDNDSIRSILSKALKSEGFIVTTVNDGAEALKLVVNNKYQTIPVDLLLTDHEMPNLTGLELIEKLNNEYIYLPTLLMTGNHDKIFELMAQSKGCVRFIKKPFTIPDLMKFINLV